MTLELAFGNCGGLSCKNTFSTGFSGLVNEPAKPSKTVGHSIKTISNRSCTLLLRLWPKSCGHHEWPFFLVSCAELQAHSRRAGPTRVQPHPILEPGPTLFLCTIRALVGHCLGVIPSLSPFHRVSCRNGLYWLLAAIFQYLLRSCGFCSWPLFPQSRGASPFVKQPKRTLQCPIWKIINVKNLESLRSFKSASKHVQALLQAKQAHKHSDSSHF